MMYASFYNGTRPGLAGIYNTEVRNWTKSRHSHGELVFSDGMSASSSFQDRGVRFKKINYEGDDKWDLVPLPWVSKKDEAVARQWFVEHEGQPYDNRGNVGFVIGWVKNSEGCWFCTEAMAEALGFSDAWRYYPGILYSVLLDISRKYQSYQTS